VQTCALPIWSSGTGGRPGGPARSHVFVHLSGAAVPILVVPEVDVVLTVHRLHAEPAADLHGKGMVLPLLKGNIRMGESVLDPFRPGPPNRVQKPAGPCARHGRLPEVRRADGGRFPRRAELAFRDPVVSVEEFLRPPWGPIGENDRAQMSWLAASRCQDI